jgi:hypothetical protein
MVDTSYLRWIVHVELRNEIVETLDHWLHHFHKTVNVRHWTVLAVITTTVTCSNTLTRVALIAFIRETAQPESWRTSKGGSWMLVLQLLLLELKISRALAPKLQKLAPLSRQLIPQGGTMKNGLDKSGRSLKGYSMAFIVEPAIVVVVVHWVMNPIVILVVFVNTDVVRGILRAGRCIVVVVALCTAGMVQIRCIHVIENDASIGCGFKRRLENVSHEKTMILAVNFFIGCIYL